MAGFNLGRRPHRHPPIGGAWRAIQVLGHPSPAFTVIVALLAGGTSLLAHTAKAATRLASNTSPEPFSNIGLSLGEDAAVLGGLTLVNFSPVLALIIFLICIGAFYYFARRILRSIKNKIRESPGRSQSNRQIVTCRCSDRSYPGATRVYSMTPSNLAGFASESSVKNKRCFRFVRRPPGEYPK